MFQTVIFDLDGTLLNTLEDLVNAANYVCQQNQWPQRSSEECRAFLGDGSMQYIRRVAPKWENSPLIVATATQQYCEYYAKHNAECTQPYQGVVALLETLKSRGVKLGIYSNKKHTACLQLAQLYFPGVFIHVQGKENDSATKPELAGTQRVLEAMEANPCTTLLVGDSVVDVETARNAGMKCCAVGWGFHSAADLEAVKPDFMADSPQDIGKIVLG